MKFTNAKRDIIAGNTTGAIKNWNEIASKLPGRTNKDCRKRWSKVGVNVNRGHWKLDEDDQLRAAVEEHGCWYVIDQIAESKFMHQLSVYIFFAFAEHLCKMKSWTVVAQKVMTRHADRK